MPSFSADLAMDHDEFDEYFLNYTLRTLDRIGGLACAGDLGNEMRPRTPADKVASILYQLVQLGKVTQEPADGKPGTAGYALRTLFKIK